MHMIERRRVAGQRRMERPRRSRTARLPSGDLPRALAMEAGDARAPAATRQSSPRLTNGSALPRLHRSVFASRSTRRWTAVGSNGDSRCGRIRRRARPNAARAAPQVRQRPVQATLLRAEMLPAVSTVRIAMYTAEPETPPTAMLCRAPATWGAGAAASGVADQKLDEGM